MYEIDGISLILLVVGVVQLIKKVGVEGNKLTLASVIVGVIVGVGFKLYEMIPAVQPWIEMAVAGTVFGLAATGLWDLTSNARSKLANR